MLDKTPTWNEATPASSTRQSRTLARKRSLRRHLRRWRVRRREQRQRELRCDGSDSAEQSPPASRRQHGWREEASRCGCSRRQPAQCYTPGRHARQLRARGRAYSQDDACRTRLLLAAKHSPRCQQLQACSRYVEGCCHGVVRRLARAHAHAKRHIRVAEAHAAQLTARRKLARGARRLQLPQRGAAGGAYRRAAHAQRAAATCAPHAGQQSAQRGAASFAYRTGGARTANAAA